MAYYSQKYTGILGSALLGTRLYYVILVSSLRLSIKTIVSHSLLRIFVGGGYSVPTPGGNPGSYHVQEYSKDKQKKDDNKERNEPEPGTEVV